MNEFFFFYVYLLIILGARGSDIGCRTHATVFRELEREGFHIDVHYLIELVVNVETASEWENCSIVLRENITKSFYANPDQLLELNRSGISQACTPERVDIEAPQHLSKSHTVYVYGQPKRSRNLIYSRLSFPIHLRYHKPKINGGYSIAVSQSPLLLIRCPTIDCKNLQKSKAPCSNCGKSLCIWTRFPYKTNNNSMTVFVPVGNLNELWFVKPFFRYSDLVKSTPVNYKSQGIKTTSKMMTVEKRHFDNPFPEFAPHKENQLIDLQTKKIHPMFIEKLKVTSQRLLEILEQHLPSGRKDGSVYTGTAGVALLYLMLNERQSNPAYLERANELIDKSLARLKNKDVSFICGDAGPLAIAAVLYYKQNKVEKSKECVSRLLGLMPRVVAQDVNVPDELLYGRVGYLYSLMFLNKHIPGIVPIDFFKQVVTAVIMSGKNLSKRENISVPLMYEWYEEYYLGGAHGIAGILYLILQVIQLVFKRGEALATEEKLEVPLMFEWHNKKYLGGAHGLAGIIFLLLQAKQYLTSDQLQLVRPTVDFLLGIRYSSGNFPSSLGSNTDRLVHWCHGAPGSVQMLCSAYQIFGDQKYLTAAEVCGDVVWERGLLRKGYGLCHGVAGNAYTFLLLYQITRDLKHLYRACKFAEWCTTYNQYQERVPDRPYSLFEGLAGTIYFLNDIQDPLNARFPGFTV